MLRARLSLALVFVILNPGLNKALSYGQQGSGEVPSITFRTNTRLVMIDAVVTDKKGQPVTGLKAEDFTVEENGKKQKLSFAVAPGSGRPAALTQAPAGILSNHALAPASRSSGGVARQRLGRAKVIFALRLDSGAHHRKP